MKKKKKCNDCGCLCWSKRCQKCYSKIDKSGANNNFYGKTHTKKSRLLISKGNSRPKPKESITKKRLFREGKLVSSFKGKHLTEAAKKKHSKFMKGRFLGEKHWNWKGGKIVCHGYINIYSPKHPKKDKLGYVREHRLVMEKIIGRYLEKNEVVHHINGIKDDNRINNLKLMTKSTHARMHLKERNKLKDTEMFKQLKKEDM